MTTALSTRILASSDLAFEKHCETWCDEAEKLRDFDAFVLLTIGRKTQLSSHQSTGSSSTHPSARFNRLVNFVLDCLERDHDQNALIAVQRIFNENPAKLIKHHGRLAGYLRSRLEIDSTSAKCFAALPGCLSSRLSGDEFRKTFELLLETCSLAVKKKNLRTFTSASEGLIAFVLGKGRDCSSEFIVQPYPIFRLCRDAVELNCEFTLASLKLLSGTVLRLGRVSLPWSGMCCESVELAFDNLNDTNDPHLRMQLWKQCYTLATVCINKWGLGIGSRLSKSCLVKVIKNDWSSFPDNEDHEALVQATIDAGIAMLSSGAGAILAAKSRNEFDLSVCAASEYYCVKNAENTSPKIKAGFVDLLSMLLSVPVEGRSSSVVTRPALGIFKRVLSNRGESSSVLERARIALGLVTVMHRAASERKFTPNVETMLSNAAEVRPGNRADRTKVDDGLHAKNYERQPDAVADPLSSQEERDIVQPIDQPNPGAAVTTSLTTNHSELPSRLKAQQNVAKRTKFHQTQSDNSDDDSDIPEIV